MVFQQLAHHLRRTFKSWRHNGFVGVVQFHLDLWALRLWRYGEIRRAIRLMRYSLRLNPQHSYAHGYLGCMLNAIGEVDEAKAALRRALVLGNPSPDFQICLDAIKFNNPAHFDAITPRTDVKAAALILDHCFPAPLSSFRFGEYTAYLKEIPQSHTLSSVSDSIVQRNNAPGFMDYARHVADGHHIGLERIRPFGQHGMARAGIAYCVFLSNASQFFLETPSLGADKIAFTLYPGGGFDMHNPLSDHRLRRLCDDKRLAYIITTQNLTHRYLIDRGFCEPDRLLHIFGGISPLVFANENVPAASLVRKESGHLNICFVARSYTPQGIEKGYDVLVKVAQRLRHRTDITFHVVGGFTAESIDLEGGQNIRFYGIQQPDFFPDFYRSMDIILSPNISLSRLLKTRQMIFDGFPTTCAVEAGTYGVAMFLADFESLNRDLLGKPIFRPGIDFELIDRNDRIIAELLVQYAEDREALHRLAMNGRAVLLREFSYEKQMRPRIDMLRKHMP
ncbi:MAG: glycosyltransferase [Alphaproteobacteria bacterium]|nr:glycosyltransferase [Alphaproteobacteria bacterium]